MNRLPLVGRGFVQIVPVGICQAAVAGHYYTLAAVASFAISYAWWHNVGATRLNGGAKWYALGAALGTVTGAKAVEVAMGLTWPW